MKLIPSAVNPSHSRPQRTTRQSKPIGLGARAVNCSSGLAGGREALPTPRGYLDGMKRPSPSSPVAVALTLNLAVPLRAADQPIDFERAKQLFQRSQSRREADGRRTKVSRRNANSSASARRSRAAAPIAQDAREDDGAAVKRWTAARRSRIDEQKIVPRTCANAWRQAADSRAAISDNWDKARESGIPDEIEEAQQRGGCSRGATTRRSFSP